MQRPRRPILHAGRSFFPSLDALRADRHRGRDRRPSCLRRLEPCRSLTVPAFRLRGDRRRVCTAGVAPLVCSLTMKAAGTPRRPAWAHLVSIALIVATIVLGWYG